MHKVLKIADDNDPVDAPGHCGVDDRFLDDAESLIAFFGKDDDRSELAALALVHTHGAAECDAIREAGGRIQPVIQWQADAPDPIAIWLKFHVDEVAPNVTSHNSPLKITVSPPAEHRAS